MTNPRPLHALHALRVWLLLALALGSAACGEGPPDSGRRPNVLLIVLDTTRADALSSYGNSAETSPHLDRLAAEGVRFANAITTDFWTLPAHASILTGLSPSEHRATSETNRLPADARTLAETLREAGYRTAAFVSNPWVAAARGFDQGFELYVETWRTAGRAGTDHLHDPAAAQEAGRWIETVLGSGRAPFFALINLNRAHLPYEPDPGVHGRLHPRDRHSVERSRQLRQVAGMWAHLAGREHFDDEDYAILRELYESEVAMTDAVVGALLERLRALGVLDDTLVIVTADHGENLGERDRIDHLFSMYDTTLRVPLLIRYPARVAPGGVATGLVSLVDLVPTVLDAAGLAGPGDLARSLLNPARRVPAFVVAENERPRNGVELMRRDFPEFDADAIDERMRMVRTERYKLIWREKNGVELYDLEQDPGERIDVAARQPAARDEMLAILKDWMSRHDPDRSSEPLQGEHPAMDPITRERLRALGYAQ